MSLVNAFLNSREFSRLVMKGKDQSFLTAEEINDAIPANIVDPLSLDLVMDKIEEFRILVKIPELEEEESESANAEVAEDPMTRLRN